MVEIDSVDSSTGIVKDWSEKELQVEGVEPTCNWPVRVIGLFALDACRSTPDVQFVPITARALVLWKARIRNNEIPVGHRTGEIFGKSVRSWDCDGREAFYMAPQSYRRRSSVSSPEETVGLSNLPIHCPLN